MRKDAVCGFLQKLYEIRKGGLGFETMIYRISSDRSDPLGFDLFSFSDYP